MINLKVNSIWILIFFLVLISLSSCTHYKKVVYLQDQYANDSVQQSISAKDNKALNLVYGDNLYINVYGTDMAQIGIFNKHPFTNAYQNEYALYMQGYEVDSNGEVELPVIGKVKVVDKTLFEAQNLIQERLNEYIVGAVVELRLLSFQITVLGEVYRPGTYTFLRRETSIFDALGKAGGMREFGDRGDVLLMRKSEGYTETVVLDLTKSDILESEFYWLEPNDIIYVKPLRSKMITVNSTTISISLAAITTLILFLNYIK